VSHLTLSPGGLLRSIDQENITVTVSPPSLTQSHAPPALFTDAEGSLLSVGGGDLRVVVCGVFCRVVCFVVVVVCLCVRVRLSVRAEFVCFCDMFLFLQTRRRRVWSRQGLQM